jgi:hypothetical protein
MRTGAIFFLKKRTGASCPKIERQEPF